MNQQELWQECRKWLKRNLTSAHFESLCGIPSVLDFAYLLRDGVILCNLLHSLDPRSINLADVYTNARTADFLSHKNIGMFLRVCRRYFGLSESDLFQASMLYDYTNFYQVLRTLKKLSNCAIVQQRDIRGFGKTYAQLNKDSGDDIYGTISEYASHEDYTKWKKDQDKKTTDSSAKIYNNVMGQEALKKSVRHANKRKFHVDEMITTEQKYVNIIEKFVNFSSTYVTSQTDRNDLFPGVFGMQKLHKELLERLKHLNQTTGRLSQAFLERIDDFYVYKDYFCKLDIATKLIPQRKTTDRHFYKAAKEFEDSLDIGEMDEIFKVPFQRLTKYKLLIEAIVKTTPEDHPDYQSLIEAADSVHDIVQCMDSMRGQRESFDIIEKIQKSIYDYHITEEMSPEEYGSLYVSSNLKVYSFETNKTELMYVFLFDNALLFCSSMTKNTELSFKRLEPLAHTFMEEIKGSSNGWRLKGKEDNKYDMFAVETFAATNWKDKLHYVLSRQNVKSDHLLKLRTFAGLSRCYRCKKLLKGIYYQGYHCQLCYAIFHEECLKSARSCKKMQKSLKAIVALNGYETNKPGHLSIKKGEKIMVDIESNKGKPFVKISTLDGMEGFVSWTCIGKEYWDWVPKSSNVAGIQKKKGPNKKPVSRMDSVQAQQQKLLNSFTEPDTTSNNLIDLNHIVGQNVSSSLPQSASRKKPPQLPPKPIHISQQQPDFQLPQQSVSRSPSPKPKHDFKPPSPTLHQKPLVSRQLTPPSHQKPHVSRQLTPPLSPKLPPSHQPPPPLHRPPSPHQKTHQDLPASSRWREDLSLSEVSTQHPVTENACAFLPTLPPPSHQPLVASRPISTLTSKFSQAPLESDLYPDEEAPVTPMTDPICQQKRPIYIEVISPQTSLSNKSKDKSQDHSEKRTHDFPWKYGRMSRKEAENRLDPTAVGTFLVRFSTMEQKPILSVKVEGKCSHMKIEKTNNGVKLSDSITFSNVSEMIDHYKHTSLEESIENVDVILGKPFAYVQFYRVKESCLSQDGSDVLGINVGDIIALHDKQPFENDENPGWWLGGMKKQVGFFHETYVEEVTNSGSLRFDE